MKRAALRRWVGGLLASLAAACAPAGAATDSASPPAAPPVILILLDTLRADHTSLVRHRLGRQTTPFLDRLATQGWVFRRAYSAASWTRPSVATIFTSRLPSSHGCEDRSGLLSPDLVTLAEVYAAGGYRTHAVVSNGQVLSIYGFDQGFDVYEHENENPRNAYVNARKLVEPALAAVDRSSGQPFFLYLHYVDPHDPLHEHEETDFDPDYAGSMDGSRETLDRYRWEAPTDPADRQRVLDLYDGEILWLDRQLERLFAKLEDRGLLDRAWVVVTSDHGEGLWDHRIHSHGQEIFEEQIRVPLLVRPPGGLPARVDVHEPISLLDLAPTLLELTGQPVPEDFEGRSWAAALTAGAPPPVRPVLIDEKLNDVHLAAVIHGDEKLLLDFQTPEQGFHPIEQAPPRGALLIDLAANPRENPARAMDLLHSPGLRGLKLYQQLVQALSAAERRRSALGDLPLPEESAEQLELLRALGYLGADSPGPAEDQH